MPAFADLTQAQTVALMSVLNQFNDKLSELKTVKAELDAANTRLSENATSIETLNTTIAERDTTIAELNTTISNSREDFETRLTKVYFDTAVSQAYQNIQLKADMPESVKDAMKATAMAQLQAMGTPKLVEVDGKQVLKIVDKNGTPVTVDGKEASVEDVLRQTSLKDIIDTNPGGGAGTKTPQVQGASGGALIAGAKTQVEADRMIKDHLISQGLDVLNQTFYAEFYKLREENKVSELPIK